MGTKTSLLLAALLLAACSTTNTASRQDVDPTPQDEPGLVIEPLVPQKDLPAGTDLHYDFAHVILPLVVFSTPPDVVREQFLGPTVDRFIEEQWRALNPEPARGFPVTRRVELHVGDAVLIEMPPPDRNAQAYFALVVFKDSGPIRYMTLERGVFMRDDDPQRTVLGEWSIEDGRPKHSNFGEGPPPTPEAFLEAVESYVR